MNRAKELLKILQIQRQSFIRKIDGNKIITNPLLYNQCEEESLRIQELIGQENRKKIKEECKERKIPFPNFKKEGIPLETITY
jgi:hypothetical protein